jgi:hypothetical protein
MLRRSVWAFSAVLLAAPVLAVPALAQGADLTRVTCQQFNRLPMPDRRQLGLWLHGYYTGTTQRPILDMARVDGAVSAMIAGCQENPDRPLLGPETGAALRELAPAAPAPDSRIIIENAQPPQPAPAQRPRPAQ